MRLRIAAVIAASLISLTLWTACGNTFRPVAIPIAGPTPSPQTRTFALVLSEEIPPPPDATTGKCSANGNPPPCPCSNGSAPPCPGALSQIDVSGDANLGNQMVGVMAETSSSTNTTPVKAVLTTGQQAYITNSTDSTVTSFFPTVSSAVTTIGLPASSLPIAPVVATFTPPGSTVATTQVYVAGYNNAPGSTNGQVFVINQGTNTLTATVSVGANPISQTVSVDNSQVFVVNRGSGTVSVISTADNTVSATITVGSSPQFAVTNIGNNGFIYVLNGNGSISTINPASDTVISTTSTPKSSPSGATTMTFDPTLQRLYVPNTGSNNVTVYDASSTSGAISELSTSPVIVQTAPVAVAVLPDGSRAYVANSGDASGCGGESQTGRVSVINAANNAVSACITVGQNPSWIAASSDGSKVYVTYTGFNSTAQQNVPGTSIIGASNNLVVANVPGPLANNEPCLAATATCVYMEPFFVVTSQ